jgi:hypothetical protein
LKKQLNITLSTTKAEYITAMHTAKEALWIWTFISEVTCLIMQPITVRCNNQSAICIIKNDEFHL